MLKFFNSDQKAGWLNPLRLFSVANCFLYLLCCSPVHADNLDTEGYAGRHHSSSHRHHRHSHSSSHSSSSHSDFFPPFIPGGAIIPYASGTPLALATLANGLIDTGSILGFGASYTDIAISGTQVSLLTQPDTAFSMPRDGILTSLSVTFTVTADVDVAEGTPNSATVQAQVYTAPANSDTFTAVPGAVVDLFLPFPITAGTVVSGITTGLDIPLPAGTQVLLVFTATISGSGDLSSTISGTASAGLNIL